MHPQIAWAKLKALADGEYLYRRISEDARRGIAVTHSPGANAGAVAEQAMALLLFSAQFRSYDTYEYVDIAGGIPAAKRGRAVTGAPPPLPNRPEAGRCAGLRHAHVDLGAVDAHRADVRGVPGAGERPVEGSVRRVRR